MDFISKELEEYCLQHTSAEPEVLKQLNRHTHANVLQPRMLSGHLQGRLLSLLSQMLKPTNILEIGTYTGYSAICLAEGLTENGKLITIDVNAELEETINKHITLANMKHKIQFIVGDAYQVIRTLNVKFDLVFIDADKQNYSRYYDLVLDKLNAGGVIFADNVLWSGKVLNASDIKSDIDTQALHSFNIKVNNDDRVENILLPIRDGLMVIRKK